MSRPSRQRGSRFSKWRRASYGARKVTYECKGKSTLPMASEIVSTGRPGQLRRPQGGQPEAIRYLEIGNAPRYEQDVRVAALTRPVGQDHVGESERVADVNGLHDNPRLDNDNSTSRKRKHHDHTTPLVTPARMGSRRTRRDPTQPIRV